MQFRCRTAYSPTHSRTTLPKNPELTASTLYLVNKTEGLGKKGTARTVVRAECGVRSERKHASPLLIL